jgi:hypothetical protein
MYGSLDADGLGVAVEVDAAAGPVVMTPVVDPTVPDAGVDDDGVVPLVGAVIADEDDDEGVSPTAGVAALDDVVPVTEAPDVALDGSEVCACASWAKTIAADASRIFGGLTMVTPF